MNHKPLPILPTAIALASLFIVVILVCTLGKQVLVALDKDEVAHRYQKTVIDGWRWPAKGVRK